MYSAARARARDVDEGFRVYVTDSLQMIPQNMYQIKRYYDLIRPRQAIDADAVIRHVESVLNG